MGRSLPRVSGTGRRSFKQALLHSLFPENSIAAIGERFNALPHLHDARVRYEHGELFASRSQVLHASRFSFRYLQS